MRWTQTGEAVTNFSMATSEKWTGQDGEKKERTIWWRVSAWGKTAENCNEYLKKGSRVLVEGTMVADPKTGNPRIWTGQDGEARASFEVKAFTVRFLSSKAETEARGADGADNAGDDTDGEAF